MRNLGMAKQRFHSLQTRLGRLVGKINASFSTAEWARIARKAGSKEVTASVKLLGIPVAAYLMLNFMADLADEIGELLLFLDDENLDKAILSEVVRMRLDRLTWLIEQKGILTSGYTAFALQHYKSHVRILNVGKNETRTFGDRAGMPPEVVTQCLQHAEAWLRLVRAVAEVEFPDFEVVACFSVLALHEVERKQWLQISTDASVDPFEKQVMIVIMIAITIILIMANRNNNTNNGKS